MEKIASFTIDHIKLQPGLYVSRKDRIGAETVTTFDLRLTKPNDEPVLNTAEVHTIEHLAATYLRNDPTWREKVVYFGPMGCRTGFYLLLAGDYESKDVVELDNGFKLYIARQNDLPVAFVIEGKTGTGYGGDVEGLISFNADQTIRTFIVTKHNETPGIGTRITDRVRVKTITDVIKGTPEDPSLPGNATLDSFKGKKAEGDLKWTKEDGIHFVSGATISSNAANDLAWNAATALKNYLKKEAK